MPKALFVNAEKREITEVDYDDYRALRTFIGGSPTIAAQFENGDVMYVDDEGLSKPQSFFLSIAENPQPLAGNAIVTGPDYYRHVGQTSDIIEGTDDVQTSIAEMTAHVRFMTRVQVESWGKANASEPSMTITTFGSDGEVTHEVLRHYGEMIANIPRPDEPEQ